MSGMSGSGAVCRQRRCPDSSKSQLTKAGIESVPVLKGLAEFDPIVELWIDNLKAAMTRKQ